MKKILMASGAILLASTSTTFAAENTDYYHWKVDVRALAIVPEPTSTAITTIGGNVTNVSTQVVPELDINYFFNPHISTELILATSKHSLTATNTNTGKTLLGNVWLLPPTLTVIYHFLATPTFDPYCGMGVNYTFFYNAVPNTVTGIKYNSNAGLAFQLGADVNMAKRWVFNVDVKKIFLSTNVNTTGPALQTQAHLDPWLFGVGFGYRFMQ